MHWCLADACNAGTYYSSAEHTKQPCMQCAAQVDDDSFRLTIQVISSRVVGQVADVDCTP